MMLGNPSTSTPAPDSSPLFSRLIAGCMKWGVWGANYSNKEVLTLIRGCVESGITSFDHADIYGDYTTEALFGQALKLDGGSALRSQIQLITKCGICKPAAQRPSYTHKHYNTSKAHIIASCERSLQNLETDYIDALLIHRQDPLLDAQEVAEAFHHLQKQGKVKYFGVSNFSPASIQMLHNYFPLVTNQIEISALHLAPFVDGSLDWLQAHRLTPMAWSPLGGGRLFENNDPRASRLKPVLESLALKYNMGHDQVLLQWLMMHPAKIHPILGTTRMDRLNQSASTLKTKMDLADWYLIWTASTGEKLP